MLEDLIKSLVEEIENEITLKIYKGKELKSEVTGSFSISATMVNSDEVHNFIGGMADAADIRRTVVSLLAALIKSIPGFKNDLIHIVSSTIKAVESYEEKEEADESEA